ncbi:hypothetical protein N7642_27490, partial [Klebsiella oxytoca]|uniref:hypothetical protein n=1 Tax=Klebsiella oxytoca TaxID=571 RepID=UPI002446BA26
IVPILLPIIINKHKPVNIPLCLHVQRITMLNQQAQTQSATAKKTGLSFLLILSALMALTVQLKK